MEKQKKQRHNREPKYNNTNIEMNKYYLKNPRMLGDYIMRHTSPIWLSDKIYIQLRYYFNFGKWLNLDNPTGFNAKCQWIKLYYRRPDMTTMVDKYAAKEWVANRIGSEHVVPCYGVWDSADAIDFDSLPNKFVMKCTHGCGGHIICKDKATLDIDTTRKTMRKGLKKSTYMETREWPYKNVKPRIIAEEYLSDDETGILTDYKFFCFDGEPKMMYVSKDGAHTPSTDFFDMEWNRLPLRMRDPNSEILPQKPENFDQMKVIAQKLSEGFPHVRVDLYMVNGNIYFGEMTFFTLGALVYFNPPEWDEQIGNWFNLPPKLPQ